MKKKLKNTKPRNYHHNVVGGVAPGEEEQEIQRQKWTFTVIIAVSFSWALNSSCTVCYSLKLHFMWALNSSITRETPVPIHGLILLFEY